jgi:hypothetical protein
VCGGLVFVLFSEDYNYMTPSFCNSFHCIYIVPSIFKDFNMDMTMTTVRRDAVLITFSQMGKTEANVPLVLSYWPLAVLGK